MPVKQVDFHLRSLTDNLLEKKTQIGKKKQKRSAINISKPHTQIVLWDVTKREYACIETLIIIIIIIIIITIIIIVILINLFHVEKSIMIYNKKLY